MSLLNPISFEEISTFTMQDGCVNFGILDDLYTSTYAYCQWSESYIYVYNYKSGDTHNIIILDTTEEQSILGIYEPTQSIQ